MDRYHQGLLPFQIAFNSHSRNKEVFDVLIEGTINPYEVCMKDKCGVEILTNHDTNPTELFKLIDSKSWKLVLSHVEIFHWEASTWEFKVEDDGSLCWRRLPLHAAIIEGASCTVINVLLRANPDGVKCQDHEDKLPYFLANEHKATKELIKAIKISYSRAKISIIPRKKINCRKQRFTSLFNIFIVGRKKVCI